jgi:poly-beta-1,6-N-acetyl-D-glucosamine synthase
MSRYLAITPARDEEKLLPGLIASMASQSHLPSRWIIIDDGSADATPAILDEAARRYPWMEVHRLDGDRPRAAGGESVIMRFLPSETWNQCDYVLRLDADLSFASDLVELLLDEFVRDPALGIARERPFTSPTATVGVKSAYPNSIRAAPSRCTRHSAFRR